MRVIWPEYITVNGTLSRGAVFRVGSLLGDFIRTRGIEPFIGVERVDAVYISANGERREVPDRRLFRLSLFGHTLVLGRVVPSDV